MNRRIYRNIAKATLAITAFLLSLIYAGFVSDGWHLEIRPAQEWLSQRSLSAMPQYRAKPQVWVDYQTGKPASFIPSLPSEYIVDFGIFRFTKGRIADLRCIRIEVNG